MLRWLERAGFAGAGALSGGVGFWLAGKVDIGGEFAANVTGAAIGGMISVGLAVIMFHHERKVADRDRAVLDAANRQEAIRQSLRWIRGIRECLIGSEAMTINTGDRILYILRESAEITEQAVNDLGLSDFPLRQSMRDAAKIGSETAAQLERALRSTTLTDANERIEGTAEVRDAAISAIDQLMANYTAIRMLPAA